jgi:signal transduction histidine kinase
VSRAVDAAGTAVLLTVELRHEQDVVLARQRAREIAALLGFEAQEQTRFSTAVSEIARNAFRYARGGRVEFGVHGVVAEHDPRTPQGEPAQLVARVTDTGPGIADLDAVLGGSYVSRTGMGLGIVGARRLTDRFDITSAFGTGTTVTMTRMLPRRSAPVTPQTIAHVVQELARRAPESPVAELQTQNRELLRTLDALRTHQADIERLNEELAETNRGVLALYAELDERAKELKRASEQKSSFLSNVSHELRTPLTSILNISRLMLDYGGEMSDEQRRQLGFIRSSAQTLAEIVNDLLDLAKIEAGRVDIRPAPVDVAGLFGTLRGMFRPLLPNESVALVFDEPGDLALVTDEGRLAQILRNFISNALKFTEQGEVRVTAAPGEGETVVFSVADTGIGIPLEDQERIFEEFVQVEGVHQKRVRGTGLGLPLSRQLARLLGGTITMTSIPGVGSTFMLTMPRDDMRAPTAVRGPLDERVAVP